MNQSLKIAVADDEPDTREFFERYLPRLGHQVTAVAENGRELVDRCRQNRPDLVITDIRMPGMDGLSAVEALFKEQAVPSIVVTAHADEQWVDRARQVGVFSYLLKPVTERDLGPAIAVAWGQWEQFQALRKEAADLRQALEDRKLIERAKGSVMRRLGVSEAEAFRRLRRYSSDHNMKLVEVARVVDSAEQVFRDMDPE
jgi:two-component system, response regulator PdtaR